MITKYEVSVLICQSLEQLIFKHTIIHIYISLPGTKKVQMLLRSNRKRPKGTHGNINLHIYVPITDYLVNLEEVK